MTKGLFQRAVFQSGVATVMGYTVKDPLMLAKVFSPNTTINVYYSIVPYRESV